MLMPRDSDLFSPGLSSGTGRSVCLSCFHKLPQVIPAWSWDSPGFSVWNLGTGRGLS